MAANQITPGELLAGIHSPEALRKLDEARLPELSDELRRYIIEHCSVYGGHFGASLGAVELTVALHYAYNTPQDQLVWDVGHQAYGHKVLTGRREMFHTNRKYKGVSGFPKRAESAYDTFGVGHSSTSISAALGMASSLRLQGDQDTKVVAIIGDGALTGGLAYEGLNNAGAQDDDLLVILNDNCMSIDPNVGAMKEYLIDIAASHTYNKIRNELWRWLTRVDKVTGVDARATAAKMEEIFTAGAFKPGILFETLGFRYFGPVDGHDVNHLTRLFRDMKDIPEPKLLHAVTVKGKGFAPAEADQTKWHAPSFHFNTETGEKLEKVLEKEVDPTPQPPQYPLLWGETRIEMAEGDDRIVPLAPAMLYGSGMIPFQKAFPERCYDVAIAEQHAVTFSAGLATQGSIPFCAIYSTFMQRAYDQVIHDVAIQDLKVIFCLDRAGLVGADGATHHGAYDIAYMRAIPNLIVSAPMDEPELRNLMAAAAADAQTHPFVIRYPRGQGVTIDWKTPQEATPIGKGRKISDGQGLAILSYGHPGNFAQAAIQELAAQGLRPAHYDLRFVKPLDDALLHEVFSSYEKVLTVEDGCLNGGAGSAVLEWMADHGYRAQVKRLGIPDEVVHQGTQKELWRQCGYDQQAIVAACREMLGAPVAV